MSPSLKALAGSMALVMVCAFARGGFCLYLAMLYSAIAPNQGTTTARTHLIGGFSTDIFAEGSDCSYSFTIDGRYFRGRGPCPQQSGNKLENSTQGGRQELDGPPQFGEATVFYDPADPLDCGLKDFKTRSDALLRMGIGLLGLGGVIVLTILGMVTVSKTSRGSGGIVVDAEGTVIYPDRIYSAEQNSANNSTRIESK
jgi:hypothetical protein